MSNDKPMETLDAYWIYESNTKHNSASTDVGKCMLFYPKDYIPDKWDLAKLLYGDGVLTGIVSMKCSTARPNPRASNPNSGMMIFYADDSSNKELIMKIGRDICRSMEYSEQPFVYYKTDDQTSIGTRATGSRRNYKYRLQTAEQQDNCDVFVD